ncbi:hypothetical protein PFICI_09497 [Pestalotiopsis fici W106-1]|uniref:Aminoglycoside phosphotransferase domain-containing protein n=1 Tax=Pestalotiopsis fici (strain W106-1 / CGMCC3.15140) TaxID=1229662 RepID=W3X0S9_PESFW|nr:uncharacterized protein PFICI_09497 [Pestalotiopsis fici W106-1]ETS79644.1 hypothetical protein PFICI_09497 [Pestalotiopsis fici W106-1]
MQAQMIAPDEHLLSRLFNQHQPAITIILQTQQKCVFKAEFSTRIDFDLTSKIVRLEIKNKESQSFGEIALLQHLAATVIPDLVPKTHQVGIIEDSLGRALHFSVTEFVEGDTLQNVWSKLSADAQDSIVVKLGEALEKLHTIRPSNLESEKRPKAPPGANKEMLDKVSQPGVFGGPHTGFIDTGSALLASFMNRRKLKKQFCVLEPRSNMQGIIIRSNFNDLGSLTIDNSESEKWSEEAVLCHNDLNPRNLIIQQRKSPDGVLEHRLAGIVDWELAGFYPASYELSLHDTYLGTANQHLSFYFKLKSYMRSCVPHSPSQIKLLKANELIYESQQRHLAIGTNIPAHVRKRFKDYFRLVRDNDPYIGWTSGLEDIEFPAWDDAVAQKMEDDVIQEMIIRRQHAKASNHN